MWVLNAKEMESSSKINLKDVSWWMSIKNACKLRASITSKFSKQRCTSLTVRGRAFHASHKYD
jgi:hypothetical protein